MKYYNNYCGKIFKIKMKENSTSDINDNEENNNNKNFEEANNIDMNIEENNSDKSSDDEENENKQIKKLKEEYTIFVDKFYQQFAEKIKKIKVQSEKAESPYQYDFNNKKIEIINEINELKNSYINLILELPKKNEPKNKYNKYDSRIKKLKESISIKIKDIIDFSEINFVERNRKCNYGDIKFELEQIKDISDNDIENFNKVDSEEEEEEEQQQQQQQKKEENYESDIQKYEKYKIFLIPFLTILIFVSILIFNSESEQKQLSGKK